SPPGPCAAPCGAPTLTTGWPPRARSSGSGPRASRSTTWTRPPRPCPGSRGCGRRCSRAGADRLPWHAAAAGAAHGTGTSPTCASGRARGPGPVPSAAPVTMRARELGRTPVVVGDHVGVVGDLSGTRDTLARIVRVEDRSTVLRRTADDSDPYERVVVANAQLLLIVVAVADPPPRAGFVA